MSGQPAFVDVHAIGDVEALLIPPQNLRALMIEEAELGERIMHALILRRVVVIEAGAGGPVLIGPESGPDVIRLQGFLARNAYPHQLLDPEKDEDAARLVQQYAPDPSDLPLAVCPKGTILKNPSEAELARALGMVPIDERDQTYDVAVVGAGPAGLSTAVYAASEGLSVIVLDARAFGGQAGASARIENYLGFPAGVSGQALTGRAYVQAQKFGARMVIPAEAIRPDLTEVPLALRLDDGRRVKAQTVVVATGAAIGGSTFQTLRISRGAVSGTGLRRSRRACAGTKRSFWSVAATRPARPRSSCATSQKKSGCWCVGQASQRACRNISSIASARSTTWKY